MSTSFHCHKLWHQYQQAILLLPRQPCTPAVFTIRMRAFIIVAHEKITVVPILSLSLSILCMYMSNRYLGGEEDEAMGGHMLKKL